MHRGKKKGAHSSPQSHATHPQQQQQHPHHPQDLAMDPSSRTSFLPSPREMYSHQMGFNHATANGHPNTGVCVKRVPPQVPERSPDTHLSTGRVDSRKSSVSSKDSCSSLELCNELNEVFEANPHLHHHPHHYDPAAANSGNNNRYVDSRPFSYAAGIDPKALQQRQQGVVAAANTNGGNGGGGRGRAVSEAYTGGAGETPYVAHGDMAARSFQPYTEYRRTPSTSSQGNVNGSAAQQDGSPAGRGTPQTQYYDPAQGSPRQPQPPQTVSGGGAYVYPPPPATHSQPPPPPPPAQMYGVPPPRVPQAPVVGMVPTLSGGSPRHVHTHHHIVTKPHPSPPASRRGSSASPGRSRSPGSSSAFQPVASTSSTSSSQSAPSSTSPPAPPPTFPAPPPPLPLQDRYLAATQETRSPSPPLPPPPLLTAAAAQSSGRTAAHGMADIPVPPGSPGGRGQHQSRSENRRAVTQSPVSGAPALGGGGHQGNGGPPGSAGALPGNRAMLQELTQSKLRKTEMQETDDPRQTQTQTQAERSQSPLGVRLKPTNGKFSKIYQQDQSPTAAPDVTPEELPPPPLPVPEELPPPPPPQPTSTHPPPAPAVVPPSSLAVPSKEGGIESQLEAAVSRMEIDIPDDIDISQCPGLVEITRATPNWKREMIEKKNRDKIEEYVKQIMKERENEAKWRNVPEWKRALLLKKDQEEQEAALASMTSPDKKAPAPPPKGGNKGEVPMPMPKPKGDIVPAALSMDPAELESMPPWKRELLFKREKVPITFSNEFNPDEEEGEEGGEPNQS